MKKEIELRLKDLRDSLQNVNLQDLTKLKTALLDVYNKVLVLEYLQQQLDSEAPQKTNNTESFDSKSYREQNWFKDPKPVPPPPHEDEIAEPLIEKIKDLVAQMPAEAEKVDALFEEIKTQQQNVQSPKPISDSQEKTTLNATLEKPKNLNQQFSKGITLGINERMQFIQQLFNGSPEDFNRVLSHIDTCQTLQEAETFIKAHVKPDYNYWLGKEEATQRFFDFLEKKFNA